ncbi:MAG: peptidoglycan recognition family protein [Nanoarchaeota archaeon]
MGILSKLEKLMLIGLATGIIFSAGVVKAEDSNLENTSKIPPKIIKNLSPEDKKRGLREHTKYIVLHTTEASDKSSINSTKNDGSTNYLILKNGEIHEIIEEDKIAQHAGKSIWNENILLEYYSIGIEVSGFSKEELTSEQYSSLKYLVKDLQERYKIQDEEVLIHAAVASTDLYGEKPRRGRKIDGLNIDMKKLGILKRPEYDPDVKSGLVIVDRNLEKILYSKQILAKRDINQINNKKTLENHAFKRIQKNKRIAEDYLKINGRL